MAWWEGASETRVLVALDILLLVGSMWVIFYHFGIPEQEMRHATSLVMEFFKNFTGSSNLMGLGFWGIMFAKDGRLYTATPVDPVFILLPIFEEARMKKGNEPGKFRQLDEIIYVNGHPGYESLSSIAEKTMQVVCDLKEIGSTQFFRLNDTKVLKWLSYKAHQLKQTLPTLDKNYAARDEKNTLFDVVSILREYLKDEPWVNMLCDKLKLNLQDLTNPPDVEMIPPSMGTGPASFNPIQENNGTDKRVSRTTTRSNKKAKVQEKDSHNIKDMFSRATRRKG
ncbi:hypothetical protein OROGR_010204 [Orobanche gracilis]